MSDIFQEVDEDLRREQVAKLWKKHGMQVIGVLVAAILIASAIVAYKEYRASAARTASLKYQDTLQPGEGAAPKPAAERLAGLDKIESSLTPGYKLIGQFERAAALLEEKKPNEAARILDAVAADTSADPTLRDVARLRAAYILADAVTFSDMKARLEKLATPESAFRFAADEILGYSAFRVGDLTAARGYYQAITSDLSATADIHQRAQDMLDEIAQRLPESASPAKPAPAKPVPANPTTKP